jgi:NNP family nitrate/nitrite transporter-like MFS transporter
MDLRAFARSGHWPTLLSAFIYFDVSFMVWVLIGALGLFLAQEFGLSATQKGFLVAVPILAGSLLRIPMGLASDRFGPKRVGAIGLCLTTLPLLWGWLGARTLTELLGVGLLLGIAGASFAAALPLASRWYPPRQQGLVMGIAGAGNSGTVLAAFFAPRLAEAFGWHAVFGLALFPVLGALGAHTLLARETPNQSPPKPLGEYLSVIREPDTWWFNLFYMVTFGGFVGLASYLPIFFSDQYGLSRVTAGSFTAFCVLAGSLLRPVGGALADRLGGIRTLTLLYGAVGALVFGVSLLPSLTLATGFLFLGMSGLGMGNGAVFQLVPQRFRHEIGVATGFVGAAGGLGGFLVPSVLGLLKDLTGSYGSGFAVFALSALTCLVLLRVLEPTWRPWLEPVLVRVRADAR